MRDYDFKPYRSLTAAVMLEAHNALMGKGILSHNSVSLERQLAEDFFLHELDQEPLPFNFNWCCWVLDLNRDAVAEKVRKIIEGRVETHEIQL